MVSLPNSGGGFSTKEGTLFVIEILGPTCRTKFLYGDEIRNESYDSVSVPLRLPHADLVLFEKRVKIHFNIILIFYFHRNL